MSCTSLFTWRTTSSIPLLCIESTFSVTSRHPKTEAPLHCKYVCQASIQKVSKLMCSSFSSETFQTYWQQKQIFTYKGRPLVGTAMPALLHEGNQFFQPIYLHLLNFLTARSVPHRDSRCHKPVISICIDKKHWFNWIIYCKPKWQKRKNNRVENDRTTK